MNLIPQFGAKVRKQDLVKFEKSSQWDGKQFKNLTETTMDIGLRNVPKLLIKAFTKRKERSPEKPIPIIPFDEAKFLPNDQKPKFIWYGHSVLLLQLNGKNLLIDPMLGGDASPIAPFASKRFSNDSLSVIDQLPPLDAVLLTHDHYDHLDFTSIKKLMPKVDTWFVAVGVSRHLEKWGVDAKQITEFDWWDETDFEGIHLTFTPSRHFSGRGAFDRAKSLWGGWVFKTKEHNIYWSGDGGYGSHFAEVGKKLGPFDWAFMECGQYNEHWHAIHMYPEEAVKAAIDAKAKVATPVHWGGFSLAMHSWKEPIERFVAEAEKQGLKISTPEIGEAVVMGEEPRDNFWWERID